MCLQRFFAMVFCLSVFGLVGAPCRAADPENPIKKTAVGDWVIYKTTGSNGATPFDGKLKLTVASKDDKEATVERASAFVDDKFMPNADMKVDLTKPYDPTLITPRIMGPGIEETMKPGDEGKETITIGKTKYECKWIAFKVTGKNVAKNAEVTYEYKIWTCPDAPLGGLVKMETKFDNVHRILILDESGKGK